MKETEAKFGARVQHIEKMLEVHHDHVQHQGVHLRSLHESNQGEGYTISHAFKILEDELINLKLQNAKEIQETGFKLKGDYYSQFSNIAAARNRGEQRCGEGCAEVGGVPQRPWWPWQWQGFIDPERVQGGILPERCSIRVPRR